MCFPGGDTPSPTVPNINIPTPNGTTAGANGAVPTAAQVGASTPLPFSDFGNIPQVQAGLVDTPQFGDSASGVGANAGGASYGTLPGGGNQGGDTADGGNAIPYGGPSPTGANPMHADPSAGFTGGGPIAAGISGSGVANTPGGTPTISPGAQLPGALKQFEDANASALQPQFQAENMALNDNIASRGIFNSGAASYLGNQQAGAQNSALAAADAPLIAGMAGAYNTDLLANQQAGLTTGGENLSAKLTTGSENQQATNAASNENAGFYGTAVGSDEQNYNNWLQQQQTQGNNFGDSLLEGYLGSYGQANPNTLSSIGGAPGAIGAAGAGATAPNFGGAFGQAFSNVPNLRIGGNSGGSGPVTTAATQPLGGGQWGAGDSGQEDL